MKYRSYIIAIYQGMTSFVFENPQLDWDYAVLSSNPIISMEDVENHPEIEWDYSYLSENPNITWENVCEMPDIEWNYRSLSSNPNITYITIASNHDKEWSSSAFLENPSVTPDMFERLGLSNREEISLNPNLTWEFIQDNPHFGWCYRIMSFNKHIRYADDNHYILK